VWFALTPGQSLVPGSNGFATGTALTDVGTCVRTAQLYLPKIWPNLGLKRDCTTFGQWTNYSEYGDPAQGGLQVITGDATLPGVAGNYILTKGSAAAITLAAPVAGTQDGAVIRIYSGSAYAHVITATGLLYTGAAGTGVLTFAAYAGAGVTLVAYNAHWIVYINNAVTITS